MNLSVMYIKSDIMSNFFYYAVPPDAHWKKLKISCMTSTPK
jgi:hypothetical protein